MGSDRLHLDAMRAAAVVAAAIVICASPLLASEVQHGAGAAEHHGDAQESPNILAGDLGNVLWTLAIFAALLVLTRVLFWKPLLNILHTRERFVRESIESAKHEREQAEKLLKQYTEQIERARVEATAIVEEGKRDAEAVRRRIHEDAKKEADEMVARAKREIAIARDDAVKALYERTLDLATDVAGKIIRRKVSGDDHRDLLNESLAEMARVET